MPLETIFGPDGRTVIVALDHGLIDGPIAGLVDPAEIIARVKSGGADAVLISYGVARRFDKDLEDVGRIVRVDGSVPGSLYLTAERAHAAGADAIAVSIPPLDVLARAVDQAHAIDLPVLAEIGQRHDAGLIAAYARMAAEWGADVIKAPYCEDFARVTRSAFVPVVILGGARKESDEEVLEQVRSSINAGGAGVAMGRNVFQADDPVAMTAALVAIVHSV
jgi:DhnA family fructose-bisphosphate aldolase class Ia